jgi:tRNA/rRNA methyltransferase
LNGPHAVAGTDRKRAAAERGLGDAIDGPAPAVILVEPQLGENIGMACRAMLNGGCTDLRLVNPRDGWPNPKATAAASGADAVLRGARVFATVEEAVADLTRVYATTARDRDAALRVMTPRAAAADMRAAVGAGDGCGVLFGREAKGLTNHEISLADTVIAAPLNPGFKSLNIAQAVLMVAYEWWQAGPGAETAEDEITVPADTRPATRAEMQGLFDHLERELDACGFLRVKEKRPTMVRNIRNALNRAHLTEQEVRTFRGIVAGLVKGGGRS